MGFIKGVKADSVGMDAQKAWDEGSVVFTPLLNLPSSHPGMSGRIKDWELMIAAIEAVGWRLEAWAVTPDGKGRPQAMPLYRRP